LGGVIDRPRDRDLSGDELGRLVAELAARPWLWRDRVRHDPEQRTYSTLIDDGHVQAWLIGWMPGHDTGFHDHDRSAAAVTVVDGLVREERLCLDGPAAHETYLPGATFRVNPYDIHRVTHGGGGPAVTIHAYSPVLERTGAYLVGADGALQRHPLAEGEELRPLDLATA
jgi:predicted metal-dependent enzyme (double-stranded beta helix superfamily)